MSNMEEVNKIIAELKKEQDKKITYSAKNPDEITNKKDTNYVKETPEEKITTESHKHLKNKKKNKNKFFLGFVSGALSVIILGGTGYTLVKESKKGKIEKSDEPKKIEELEEETKSQENVSYNYDYSENVVIIEDNTYETLTTEKFEDLTSNTIKTLTDLGLDLTSEDIIKFSMIVNIDKLSQDNIELMQAIIGEQNTDEVFQDADKVIGSIVMYNYNYYYENYNTQGFIRVSDFIFDEESKKNIEAIEKRVYEVIANSQNNEEMNESIHSLLLDLCDPQNELSYLEAGVEYLLQVVLEPVRGLFGMDLYGNITLSEDNNNLIKYFVPYAGDEQEFIDNNMLTGSVHNINDILNECTHKTLTK